MKLIQQLSDRISEEISDAKYYAKFALEVKDEHPDLSQTLYNISLEEMGHMGRLHDAVAKIIADYRKEKGEPPASMMAVYEYLHKRQIEKAAEAKALQAMYKGN